MHLVDARIIGLTQVVPNGSFARNDIGLIPAVRNHIVGTLLGAQVLASIVPSGIHEFDGVQRAPASPWRAGAVRGFAKECVLDGYQAAAVSLAPAHGKIVADVREQADIDVFEET